MKPALLDTNVLLALAWPNHQHHGLVHAWFAKESRYGWATCAITQLGFVRLSSNPAYTTSAVSPQDAAQLLSELLSHKRHAFWPSPTASRRDIYFRSLGHQQVTDAYLVEVAKRRRGRLVTLDTRLPVHAEEQSVVSVISS